MSTRSLYTAVFFFLILISAGILFKPVIAQSCPAERVIDLYTCDLEPIAPGVCADPVRDPEYTKITVDCSLQDNECKTVGGNCSSLDTCEYNAQFNKCLCTYNQADCNDLSGGTPPPGGGCTTTAPVITSVVWALPRPSIVTTSWNNGSGGQRHAIGASANYFDVLSSCVAGTNCIFSNSNATSPYTVNKNFSIGTIYFFRVVNVAGTCSKDDIETTISSCDISPSSLTLNEGESAPITVNISSNPTWISSVDFSSLDTTVATVSPDSDITWRYRRQLPQNL